MKNLKYIFFDNDGILVDTEPLFFEANRQILLRNGSDLTLEEHTDINMTQGKSVLKKITTTEESLKQLTKQRDIIYLDLIQQNGKNLLIPNVEVTLDALKGCFSMGIVTSSQKNTFDAIHTHTNIRSFMDFILTRDAVTHSKPNPHAYLKALEIAKITPKEALVIEDSERGIMAAHKANIECWAIPTSLTKHQNFSKAKKVLKAIDEVSKCLL